MRDVKVALVNPGRNIEYAATEPLNLEYIASYLEKNGIEVKIIDELAGQNVEDEIKKYNPTIVGLTATTPVVLDAYRIADMCRKNGILTVIGGVHVSILSEEALKHVDIVVVGEGERAMLDIIKDGIKSGIVTRPYIENIDEIPMPARHLVDMDFYFEISSNSFYFAPNIKTGTIITSRGCPFQCMFCHNSWRKTPFRFHSAERVIDEIKYMIEKYDIKALFFADDNLFSNKPRLEKICDLIKENSIDIIWGCSSRVDNITPELLKKVKEVGCVGIGFGFESGSQRILDVVNKKTTVEQNKKAIKLCKEAGILMMGSFMIGNPTETVEDVRTTQNFIKENDIDFASIFITTPFPGTKLWEWCEEHNLIPEPLDWSEFMLTKFPPPILACQTIPSDELKRLFDETNEILIERKQKIPISWMIKTGLKHPIRTINMINRKKSDLSKYLKRLKL